MTSPPFRALDAVREIRDDATLNAMQKLIAYTLISRAQQGSGAWTWSQDRIAKDAAVVKSTVKVALKALTIAGKISIRARTVAGSNERDCSEYTVEVGRQTPQVGQETADGGALDAQQVGRQTALGGAPDGQITDPVTDPLTDPLTPATPRGGKRTLASDRRRPETPAPASDASAVDVEAWCDRWRIPIPTTDTQASSFLEHAREKDRRCRDWSAAWRRWQGKASEFANTTRSRAPGQQPFNEAASWYQAAS